MAITLTSLGMGLAASYTAPAPYKVDMAGALNEDAFLVHKLSKQFALLAVADGAGGHPGGDIASKLLIASLEQFMAKLNSNPASLRETILNAVEACNQELLKIGAGSLTTAAVVEINENTIRPIHVGDSSIMVVGQRGRIKFQSTSHSTVGFGVEAGLIEEAVAHKHEDRHWVINFVGTSEMRIELGAPLTLARYDTLIVCSDAITDNLRVQQVADCIRVGALDSGLEKLISLCQERMSDSDGNPDDLSVILYRRSS